MSGRRFIFFRRELVVLVVNLGSKRASVELCAAVICNEQDLKDLTFWPTHGLVVEVELPSYHQGLSIQWRFWRCTVIWEETHVAILAMHHVLSLESHLHIFCMFITLHVKLYRVCRRISINFILLVLNAGNFREWSISSLIIIIPASPPATHPFPAFSTSKISIVCEGSWSSWLLPTAGKYPSTITVSGC